MYIGFKQQAKTLSMIEKLSYRIRRCINNTSDYKSRGVNASSYSDYTSVIGRESHIIYFIKRRL